MTNLHTEPVFNGHAFEDGVRYSVMQSVPRSCLDVILLVNKPGYIGYSFLFSHVASWAGGILYGVDISSICSANKLNDILETFGTYVSNSIEKPVTLAYTDLLQERAWFEVDYKFAHGGVYKE